MYVVGFNGPPYSGKDTAAAMLAQKIENEKLDPTLPIYQDSLSLPLREIVYAMVGRNYDPITYDDFKCEKFPQFENRSGRQLMIDVSESFLKPVYGQPIMANLLAARYDPHSKGVLLIRGLGFQCEVDPLCKYFGWGNVRIVHVNRTGHSFSGDSREWVYGLDNTAYQLSNHGGLDILKLQVDKLYYHLVEALGWQF